MVPYLNLIILFFYFENIQKFAKRVWFIYAGLQTIMLRPVAGQPKPT